MSWPWPGWWRAWPWPCRGRRRPRRGARCGTVRSRLLLIPRTGECSWGPAPGTFTVPPVSLSVCAIPATVTVPAVTGLAGDQAQGTITNAGLTVGTITLSGNCDVPPGTVIRQAPAAGTTASRGSAVNLTEATPPKPHGCTQ